MTTNGGSAFPVNTAAVVKDGSCFGEPGMTLRDYFAASAMRAYIGRTYGGSNVSAHEYDERIARWAYESADAMLRERTRSAQ